MIDENIFNKLKLSLKKSWLKKNDTSFNSSSVAITQNSNYYYSGILESKTHLLDISSEQSSLVLAVSNKDPKVKEIITLLDGEFMLDPLILKLIIDHIRRTDVDIKYSIYDLNKNKLFSTNSVYNFLSFYNPQIKELEKIKSWNKKSNKVVLNKDKSIKEQLYSNAVMGGETHFSSDSKTCYGASVLTENNIYFGGVYSSFDKRLSLHAETVGVINAIMNDDINIKAIGLVSNKFVGDNLPQMCGCCRQFLIEIMQKTSIPIKVYCFSFNNKKCFEINLDDYLPYSWDSNLK
ncbi:MAG: hypothetical protein ACOC16_03655 [Nanoarchaeota archaeon]